MSKLRHFMTQNSHRFTRWDGFVVAIISVVYSIITALFLGDQSSYFDEGYTSYLARFDPLQIAHYTALDVHPPLYYVLLHYWQDLVGFNVFALRSVSIVWGVVAIIFGFLIALRLFGRRAAYYASFFMVISPLFIRYSEAMRMYTMALALVTVGTYILIRLTSSERLAHPRRWWFAYGVVVSCGMWTNYFTAFMWLAHLLWLGYEYWHHRGAYKASFIAWWQAVAVAVALYLPWLPWSITRFTSIQASGFWIKPVSVDTLVSNLTTGITYNSSTQITNWQVIGVGIYIVGALIAIATAYRLLDKKQQAPFRLLLLCAITPVVTLVLMSMPPLRSSYTYRYALNGAFFLTLVVGCSAAILASHKQWRIGRPIVLTIAFVLLVGGVVNAKEQGNRNLDTGGLTLIQQVMTAIDARATPGEPILALSPYTYYTAALYETPAHHVYYRLDPALRDIGSVTMLYDHAAARGINNLATFGATHPRVWLISEDRYNAAAPPGLNWHRLRSIALSDPSTGQPTNFATEYATANSQPIPHLVK